MLDVDELADVAGAFGVAESQVRQDHFVSHLLAALGTVDLPLTFFGGTALARTHVADPQHGARLSEDVDLYSPRRREVAATLDAELPRLVRREFPGCQWDPPLSRVRPTEPGHLVTSSGPRIRIQLLDSDGAHHELARWPTEIRPVELRYRDLPGSVPLRVPTLAAFAAMKTIAWLDRHTARDLYDLAGLARLGAITAEVMALVRGATGWAPTPQILTSGPVPDWETQLAHQTRSVPTVEQCLAEVRLAYARLSD